MRPVKVPKPPKSKKIKVRSFEPRPRSRRAFNPDTVTNSDPNLDASAQDDTSLNSQGLLEQDQSSDHTESELNASVGTQNSSRRSQLHSTRREHEAENYKGFRKSYEEQISSQSFHELLRSKCKSSRDSLSHFIAEASQRACCTQCGLAADHCNTPAMSVPVHVLSLSHSIQADIPIYQCSR